MKIVVGGQLRKDEIKELVLKFDPNAIVDVKSDMEGALALQNGEYDMYLGACDTGGGGALAIAVSLLGVDKAKTVATQSARKSEEEIKNMIDNGVIAFGFVESECEYAVKKIINLKKGE